MYGWGWRLWPDCRHHAELLPQAPGGRHRGPDCGGRQGDGALDVPWHAQGWVRRKPPTNKPVTFTRIDIYRCKGGKRVETWRQLDASLAEVGRSSPQPRGQSDPLFCLRLGKCLPDHRSNACGIFALFLEIQLHGLNGLPGTVGLPWREGRTVTDL